MRSRASPSKGALERGCLKSESEISSEAVVSVPNALAQLVLRARGSK